MHFRVVNFLISVEKEMIYLVNDKWDDWFTYETLFKVFYYDKEGKEFPIGSVKIGQKDQIGRRPHLPSAFECLSEDYFSLGTNEDYYENLKKADLRDGYFRALKDIAFDLEIFLKVSEYDVTKVSLII